MQREPLKAVAHYYSGRVRKFGPTPWGVDWTCELTQNLRFVQLLKVAGRRRRFSLNDLGCGYGALLPFIRQRYGEAGIDYLGADASRAMIGHARRLWQDDALAAFRASHVLPRVADYSVASGLFNVHLGLSPKAWVRFIEQTLQELHAKSSRGFAVNFLLPPQPGLEPLQGLYRTTPEPWVAYCRDRFGAQVTVVQGYGLREFTLLVRPHP